MHLVLGFIALIGLCLSLIVHVYALLGIDVQAHTSWVWGLHSGIFVVFIPLVSSSRKVFGNKPTFAQIRTAFPAWVIGVGACVFGYAIVNFLLSVYATGGYSPSVKDGKYILESHGHFIKEITISEYTAFKANEVRVFSGHWIAFYYMSFAYFIFLRENRAFPFSRQSKATAEAED